MASANQIIPENLQTETFTHYFVHGGSESKHLMIILHGLGDSLYGYAGFPNELNIPNMSYLLINAPDSYFGGFSWYQFDGDPEPGITRSREYLWKLFDELKTQGLDESQIFLFGFSQGSLMVLDTALRYSRKLAGIIGVSGYLGLQGDYPDSLSDIASQQNILLTAGTEDPVIPFAGVQKQYDALLDMGVSLKFEKFTKEHTILPPEISLFREWVMHLMA